ncbi:hypothetical protein G3436_07990 [Pseudomonas sp. MAFF212427]|uniref:Uncharacterized protein n=1 Tax=Pseudomonas brassicae TaxID=2708063 RepID=A0A6B3NP06_9PSED|nr:hypothetical protein [Pseudomonas brassicae]NER63849.1 hypothetical protein [Pseudomonas brassicae]
MGEQINFFAVRADFTVLIDKAIPLGIVEPLDFAGCHPHIPLQRTPSLEYHPLHPHMNLRKFWLTARIFIDHGGLLLVVTPFCR